MNGPHVNKMFKSIIHYTIFIFQSKLLTVIWWKAWKQSAPVKGFMTIFKTANMKVGHHMCYSKNTFTSNSVKLSIGT